jgi:hypothetical protein
VSETGSFPASSKNEGKMDSSTMQCYSLVLELHDDAASGRSADLDVEEALLLGASKGGVGGGGKYPKMKRLIQGARVALARSSSCWGVSTHPAMTRENKRKTTREQHSRRISFVSPSRLRGLMECGA